jgi:hypothetical protein
MPLSPRDKRTLRLAALGLAVYLVAFYGFQGLRFLEGLRRSDDELRAQLRVLELDRRRAATRRVQVEKLRRALHVEIERLEPESVVAGALAAIQRSAQAHAVDVESSREVSAGGPSATSRARLEIHGAGLASAVLRFVAELDTLGYPLAADHMTLTASASKPGGVEMSLHVVVLWRRAGEATDA